MERLNHTMRLIVATTSTEVTCQPDLMKTTAMHNVSSAIYRERLINKIGMSRVLLLEAKKNQTCKLSDFELKVMISHYKAEVKKMEEEKWSKK